MNLLTFAHRGEAQQFLKYDKYQSEDFKFEGLYNNHENYLLLTGEGLQSTTEKLNIFFQIVEDKIFKVINLGIAGALYDKLEIESIHSIKQILKENENETFQSADAYANIDCISAINRIENNLEKNQLAKRADILDRELWSCAKVCNMYQIPIYSYKLISDYADETIDPKKIIRNAKSYSKKLYDYYKSINI